MRDDTVAVLRVRCPVCRRDVPNYGTAFADLCRRRGFRVGRVRVEDETEILFFYDRDGDNFGYALNLSYPEYSGWGHAPFA